MQWYTSSAAVPRLYRDPFISSFSLSLSLSLSCFSFEGGQGAGRRKHRFVELIRVCSLGVHVLERAWLRASTGHGKLYHPNKPPNNDEPSSWSQNQAYSPSSNSGCSGKGYDANQTTIRFCPGTADVGNASYSDVNVTMNALNTLKTVMAPAFKKDGTNFALFLGLHFPHQPWYTPAWAVNLYPPAGEIAAAKHMYSPIAVRLGRRPFCDHCAGTPPVHTDAAALERGPCAPRSHSPRAYGCVLPLAEGAVGSVDRGCCSLRGLPRVSSSESAGPRRRVHRRA